MDIVVDNRTPAGSSIPGRFRAAIVLLCVGAGIAAAVWGWPLAFAPLAIGAVVCCILLPNIGLVFLICSMFVPYSFIPDSQAYPIDFVIVFVIGGFWLGQSLKGKSGLIRTPVDVPMVLWLGALALSVTAAHDPGRGLLVLRHHVMLALLFYTVVRLGNLHLSKTLTYLLLVIVAVISVINISQFVATGGSTRVFGIANVHFSGMLTLAMVYLTARICLERKYGLIVLQCGLLLLAAFAQVANQSRGAILLTIIGMAIVMMLAFKWGAANPESRVRRRVLLLTFLGLTTATVIILAVAPLLEHLWGRIIGSGYASLSLDVRFFLWKTCWEVFLDNPFLGIGLGQITTWQNIFPTFRLDPLGPFSFGMTAHNSFLGYLAETGLVGVIPLLWLLFAIARQGSFILRRTYSRPLAGHLLGLWGIVLIIIIRVFLEDDAFHSIPGAANMLFSGLIVGLSLSANSSPESREQQRYIAE